MMLKVLDVDNELIIIESGDMVTSLAAMSAFSFLGIPTCEGTHMKHIGLFISNINFCMYWISSFLE